MLNFDDYINDYLNPINRVLVDSLDLFEISPFGNLLKKTGGPLDIDVCSRDHRTPSMIWRLSMTWTHPTSCLSMSVMLPFLMEARYQYFCHQAQDRKSGNLMVSAWKYKKMTSLAPSRLLLFDTLGLAASILQPIPHPPPLSSLVETITNRKHEPKAGCIYNFT